MNKIQILITTFNRPELLLALLKNIKSESKDYNVSLLIINDHSSEDYSKVISYLKRHFSNKFEFYETEFNSGKICYWQIINFAYSLMTECRFDYFIQLPDDVTLVKGFFHKSISYFEAISDKNKTCLNILNDYSRNGKSFWTSFKTIDVEFSGYKLFRTGWIDLCFISTRKYFKALEYSILPVHPAWSGHKEKSSGVGLQLSRRLISQNYSIYQVKNSLVIHNDHPSVMHPELRKTQPLLSIQNKKTFAIYKSIKVDFTVFDDHIGNIINKTKKFYELPMLKYIDENCQKSGIYIDVGANIGNHSVFFAKYCTNKVYSIEPVRSNYDVLVENLEQNNLINKVRLFNLAATNQKNKKYSAGIVSNNMGMCFMQPGNDIDSVIIDEIDFDDKVTLIKIDCEGMDIDVLRGCVETIKKHSPDVFIEAATDEYFDPINKLLSSLGYFKIRQFNATPTYLFKKDKVTASVASIPGREESLKDAVNSILHQVDQLQVYLNNYDSVPDYLLNDKIKVFLSKDHLGDLGDSGKFFECDKINGYHITIDDDLIYPDNYVESLISAIAKYDKKCVVSYHGRIFKNLPVASYYKGATVQLGCLKRVAVDQFVHVVGTGVLAYHTDTIKIKLSAFKFPNMADIWFSEYCNDRKISRVVLAHPSGWITLSEKYDEAGSIFTNHINDDKLQTEITNSVNWKLPIVL